MLDFEKILKPIFGTPTADALDDAAFKETKIICRDKFHWLDFHILVVGTRHLAIEGVGFITHGFCYSITHSKSSSGLVEVSVMRDRARL